MHTRREEEEEEEDQESKEKALTLRSIPTKITTDLPRRTIRSSLPKVPHQEQRERDVNQQQQRIDQPAVSAEHGHAHLLPGRPRAFIRSGLEVYVVPLLLIVVVRDRCVVHVGAGEQLLLVLQRVRDVLVDLLLGIHLSFRCSNARRGEIGSGGRAVLLT